MGAFNNGRFNLQKFNRKSDEVLWLSVAYDERIRPIIATSSTSFYRVALSEIVNNTGNRIANGRIVGSSSSEIVSADNLKGQMFFKISFSENVEAVIISSKTLWDDVNFVENLILNTDSYISQNVQLYQDLVENIGEEDELFISQIFYENAEEFEVVDATTSVESYTEYICDLSGITLPPGGVLIIDANNYNVLLNKQNAIHYQKGDWIDEINRNTETIKISASNTNGLEVSILYTERYL